MILSEWAQKMIYGPEELAAIRELVDLIAPPQTLAAVQQNPALLKDCDVIFSGWGAPCLDAAFLQQAPRLKAFFYGAGSVRGIVTDATWERGIVVTSAYAANAIPVAEFCVSQILFSLKLGWRHVMEIKTRKQWIDRIPMPGAYKTTVGLISLGMIGRKTLDLLRPYDVSIVVYSTSLTPAKAAELGVRTVDLDELFRISHVVSLHTPNLPETRHMIRGRHFRLMQKDATFLNTARGAVVHEPEMIEVLRERPDLTALLDVTDPEPPVAGSPLYDLPNVILTPHIAGSLFGECRRMGQYAITECRHWLKQEPQEWPITREIAARLA